MNGIVIKTTGKNYTVKMDNREIVQCRLKGKFRIKDIRATNPVVVGDIVEIEQKFGRWSIIKLKDRSNQIVRRSVNLSKEKHVIAANIDQAILMITLENPITTTSFIDRFLVAANAYAIDVFLIFNKMDLLKGDSRSKQRKIQKVYEKIGYKCLSVSVIQDDLKDIKNIMKGKVNMISGHSGVGKSSLINKLQPNLNIDTKDVSATNKQGQHTTTFSELYELDFGSSIIDTPGIRGFGLVTLDLKEIGNFFPEFNILKSNCKFHNCIHKNEPKCAVKEALKKGFIAQSRYKNYLNMMANEEGHFRTNSY